MEAQWKEVLLKARQAIDEAQLSPEDRDDLLDDFGKLTTELEKPEHSASRIARFFNRIQELAPPAASILSSLTSLTHLFVGDSPPPQP
jgi:hypothetical protein